MATAPDPLIAWLLDELQPLAAQIGEIRARRMFGGAGLYHDDIVFALVIRGTCYLRVDDATRARFAAEGGTPFQYEREGRTITMTGYLSTPADALDGGQPLRDLGPPGHRSRAARGERQSRQAETRAGQVRRRRAGRCAEEGPRQEDHGTRQALIRQYRDTRAHHHATIRMGEEPAVPGGLAAARQNTPCSVTMQSSAISCGCGAIDSSRLASKAMPMVRGRCPAACSAASVRS